MTSLTIAEVATSTWSFAEFEIDLPRREIARAGQIVDAQPRVFDLIVHLIRNRHRVVDRNELLDEVWGTRFVAASTVNGRVRTARRLLGDTGDAQAVIRTVHGRGYRFVADVDTPADTGETTTPTDPTDTCPGRERHCPAAPAVEQWPLVGRAEVLDTIDRAFHAGEGGVLLRGDDGVGTTRTAVAAADRLAAHGAPVVPVRGLVGGGDLPLSSLAHLIDPSVLESVHSGADLARTDILRRATEALRALDVGARRRVLLVDDVHHLDAMSVAVIAALVESRAAFAVIAARRAPLTGSHSFDPLVDIGSLRPVTLEPLTAIQVDALLYRALGGPMEAASIRSFAERSGGRPGHVRDLVDRALATGSLVLDRGVWRLAGPLPPRVALVWPPPGLSDAAIRAAEVLAIVGEVPVSIAAELWDGTAMDELDAAGLLTVATSDLHELVCLAEPALATAILETIGRLRLLRLRRDLADRLLAADPHDPSTLAAALDCLDGSDESIDRVPACEVARRALIDGDVVRAARLIDRMAHWDDPDAIVLRAELAAHRSQWELADLLVAESTTLHLEPHWRTTAVTLGADLDFFQRGHHDHAITTLSEHAAIDGGDVARALDRRLWLLAEHGAAATLRHELSVTPAGTGPERLLARAASSLLNGHYLPVLAGLADVETEGGSWTIRHIDAALSLRCESLRELGRLDEARELARASIARFASRGLGSLPVVAAQLEVEAGHPLAARALLDTLAHSSHARRHPHLRPIVAGTSGIVEMTLGHHAAAEQSIASAEQGLGLVPSRTGWALRLGIAQVLGRHDPDEARRRARRVADEARRLGAAVPEATALVLVRRVDQYDGSTPSSDLTTRIDHLAADFEGERWRSIRSSLRSSPATAAIT